MRRSTSVVSGRLATRRVRDQLAREGRLGASVLSLAGVAARLAGGFGRAVAASEVRRALQAPPLAELDDLKRVAGLPGFARAAAGTLQAAWDADLDLAARAATPGADARWAELVALERHVRAQLPAGTLLPRELVAAARARAHLAPRLLGDLTLERLDDVPPLYRELLLDIAEHVRVVWHRLDDAEPAWAPGAFDRVPAVERAPARELVSCADPAHEALEALRWVRSLLASGVPASDIAVGAVDVASYDDVVHTQAAAAELPLHAAHGVAALTTPAGQFAAALADALLAGPDQARVRRVIATARAAGDEGLGALPEAWCADLDPDAALDGVPRWRRALEPLAESAPQLAEVVLRLVMDLSVGPAAANTVGERWLSGAAKQAWRHALTEGPAAALPASLQRLRLDDGVDPATAVVWGSAGALLGWPRAHVRLLGLSARSWPRRGSDEDPLLPRRVLGDEVLTERTLARRDTEHLLALLRSTTTTLVASRPRRGSDGRQQSPSPLWRTLLTGATEREVTPREGTQHALHEADRRASRRRELAADPAMQRARAAFQAAFALELGPHDGLVRPRHPAVTRALQRRHSATSLRKLLRNPHGFVATYALGWTQPRPQRRVLALEPVDRGSLLHELLEDALTELQRRGALTEHDEARLHEVVEAACGRVAERWELERPVPPPLAWQAELKRARRVAVEMLALAGEPYPGQRSYAELPFGFEARAGDGDVPRLWPPDAEVTLPGTDLRLRGVIDRLDLDEANRRVRVIDYKSGKDRELKSDLEGGEELQRTIYTAVVKQLLGAEYTVEAGLLYAGASAPRTLTDPDASVRQLADAVNEAVGLLERGRVLPGPGVTSPYEETLLAYPATGAHYYYERVKRQAIDAERGELDRLLGITA